MSVMMMPMVLLNKAGTKEWRGFLSPPHWDNWFASYNLYMTYMSDLAARIDGRGMCSAWGRSCCRAEPFRERCGAGSDLEYPRIRRRVLGP